MSKITQARKRAQNGTSKQQEIRTLSEPTPGHTLSPKASAAAYVRATEKK